MAVFHGAIDPFFCAAHEQIKASDPTPPLSYHLDVFPDHLPSASANTFQPAASIPSKGNTRIINNNKVIIHMKQKLYSPIVILFSSDNCEGT
jgi:hypothetical protein